MRPLHTKGERRIGKTIRKLEGSVEFSSKESKAKKDESKFKQNAPQQESEDSPVQSLRFQIKPQKNE